MTQDDFLRRQEEAREQLARAALATPGVFPQAGRLMTARRGLIAAQAELVAAQAGWNDLIAPANGWAPDPLKA